MRKGRVFGGLLVVLSILGLSLWSGREASDSIAPQSVKKPKFDYMSSILSRNTKPLGLKDNLVLRKFLNQPSIKWAIRSGRRHVLN